MQLIPLLQIIVALIIIVLIIIQERGGGMSGLFGGGGGGGAYQTRRGVEKIIFISTIVATAVFVILALAAFSS